MNDLTETAPRRVLSVIRDAAVIAAEPRNSAPRRIAAERSAWSRTPWRAAPAVVPNGGWGRRRS